LLWRIVNRDLIDNEIRSYNWQLHADFSRKRNKTLDDQNYLTLNIASRVSAFIFLLAKTVSGFIDNVVECQERTSFPHV